MTSNITEKQIHCTHEQIHSMEISPALDSLVAARVLGLKHKASFKPSKHIADAWSVVEKMEEMGFFLRLKDESHLGHGWFAYFYAPPPRDFKPPVEINEGEAPHAICVAALIAILYRTNDREICECLCGRAQRAIPE